MPLISATSYSAFPNRLDTFPTWRDSQGADSAISAEIWNKIMHALLQVERHSQKIVRTTGNRGDGSTRKRVVKTRVVTVGSPAEFIDTTVQLTAAQFAFLGSQLFRFGTYILADVIQLDAAGQFVAEVSAAAVDTVTVRFRAAQIGTNVPAGDFLVQVTVMGV